MVLIAPDNNPTLPFILDNFHIAMKYLERAAADGSLVGTLFGVLSPDHVGSLCLARPTKPRLLGHHSAVEAELHPSATYDFRLLLGNRV